MSYASETKKIICERPSEGWCCKLSELSALIAFGATYKNGVLKIKSESEEVFNRLLSIMDDAVSILKQKITIPEREGGRYVLTIKDAGEIKRLCDELGFNIHDDLIDFTPDGEILENDCCKKSFIRGAYLMGGSISDPEKNYHLEFVCRHAKAADSLFELLCEAQIKAKLTVRKNSFVIYIKEFEAIANLMGIIGAGSKMMDLYNLKIERELNQKNYRRGRYGQSFGKFMRNRKSET